MPPQDDDRSKQRLLLRPAHWLPLCERSELQTVRRALDPRGELYGSQPEQQVYGGRRSIRRKSKLWRGLRAAIAAPIFRLA